MSEVYNSKYMENGVSIDFFKKLHILWIES